MIVGGAIAWSVAAELPPMGGAGNSAAGGATGERRPNLGLAGPFAGVSGDVLMIGGGANFPHGKPWEGGTKAYSDEVYVMRRGAEGGFSCERIEHFRLPEKVAYGCSVTVPSGIVCIGGEGPGGYSASVFLLSFLHGAVVTRALPPLPHARANACAAAIGSRVYVVGGEDARRPLADGYTLDLDAVDRGWQPLPPMPVAMSHSVAVMQVDRGRPGGPHSEDAHSEDSRSEGSYPCIYVVGGRSKTDSGISDLHSTLFCFDPRRGSWQRLADIGDGSQTTHLSAANAVAMEGGLLVIGGDRGDIFHQIEVCNARIADAATDSARMEYTRRKLALVTDHPGFSRDILFYDPRSDRWKKIGTLPGAGPVTTAAVCWKGEVFIPCGEIRPGVRSSEVLRGVIRTKF